MAVARHTIELVRINGELKLNHTIDGEDQGDISLDETIRVNSREKVEWKCGLGSYSVLFQAESPFLGGAVSLGAGKGKSTSALIAKSLGGTPDDPKHENFKYFLLLIEGASGTTLDPDLEIDDSGGGGN
jgi:hypothetical protein